MKEKASIIHDVSDTAFWVAYYRAKESVRSNALFNDDLAHVLIDGRAQRIAESMPSTAAHTRHNVIIRTVIIDRFIQDLLAQGVDTVINLGAGLDTRPYRLPLPASLRWIEIDYPHLMSFKNEKLKDEKPRVRLERIALDLSDRKLRQELFQNLNTGSARALILTEGVLPYLTLEAVGALSEDLHAQKNFQFWIADYLSPHVYPYLQTNERKQKMKNAPFQFFPTDPLGFFETRGWITETIRYIPEVAGELGRKSPAPWWALLFRFFMNSNKRETFMKSSGYRVMTRQN